jgi:hypothetical protein
MWMAQAISAYCLEQEKKHLKSSPHWVFVELQDTCFVETGNHIKLSHMTLKHLVERDKTCQQTNVNQSTSVDPP